MLEYIIYAWFVIGVPVIGLYALGTAAHNLYIDWITKALKVENINTLGLDEE